MSNEDAEALAIARRLIAEKKDSADWYQQSASKFAIYPQDKGLEYLSLGLASEAGEVAGKVKKIIRDKNGILSDEDKQALAAELGDVLWYVAMLAQDMGIKLSYVFNKNIDKLQVRMDNNTIGGSGDNR